MIRALVFLLPCLALAQSSVPNDSAGPAYVLGPGDEISISVLGLDDLPKTIRIDASGNIDLAICGTLQVGGLTIAQAAKLLDVRLEAYMHDPHAAIAVTQYGSQPVSVLGAVNHPGVYQLEGRKTLVEVLSLAGGLDENAGYVVKVTRPVEAGDLPLPGAALDPAAKFRVAQVNVRSVINSSRPQENILIRPHDVVAVPAAELVYVIGSVHKSGGFVLGDREKMSVLQALSLAEGLDRTASAANARILRPQPGKAGRAEVPIDVKKILAGRAQDVPLEANDILFVPDSTSRRAAVRAMEAAIQLGTGVVIWRR